MISIVIPTYNHAKHISHTLDELMCIMNTQRTSDAFDYEIIVVNDASQDHTTEVLKKYSKQYAQIHSLILAENVGQQNATLAGLRYAKYDYIFTYDDDLKYDPKSIFELKKHLDAGCDVVYGYISRPNQKPMRFWGTRFKEWFFYRFLGKPRNLCLTSYRGMRRFVVEYIIKDCVPNVYISARILQMNIHIKNHPVNPGEHNMYTRYSTKKLVQLMLQVIFNYTRFNKFSYKSKQNCQYIIKEIFE